MRERHGEYAFGDREGYPTFPFHPEYRRTMLASITLASPERPRVTLIPCMIRPEGHPEPLPLQSDEASDWLKYLIDITAAEGLTTRYEPETLAFDPTLAAVSVVGS